MSADARTLADRLEAALPLIGAAGHHILLSLCHDAAVLLRDLAAERDALAAENERLRRGINWEPIVSDRIPAEFVAELSDKFLCRYDVEALDRSLADCGFRIIADAVDGPT